MSLPRITTRDEWRAARKELQVKEKELTKRRDALNVERRKLPMVEITKDYEFDGPDGQVGLLDLFEGRKQLIIYHFMFHPEWDDGCPSCTAGIDEVSPGFVEHLPHPRHHLRARVTRAAREARAVQGEEGLVPALVLVGRRRLQLRLRRHDRRLPWVRRVQLPLARRVRGHGRGEHEDGRPALRHARPELLPARSTAASSTPTPSIARGLETTGGSYYFLDHTALGRQEEWEEPKGRSESARSGTPDFAS